MFTLLGDKLNKMRAFLEILIIWQLPYELVKVTHVRCLYLFQKLRYADDRFHALNTLSSTSQATLISGAVIACCRHNIIYKSLFFHRGGSLGAYAMILRQLEAEKTQVLLFFFAWLCHND
jgi:hypothetical protein